jgi:hypothetical protein
MTPQPPVVASAALPPARSWTAAEGRLGKLPPLFAAEMTTHGGDGRRYRERA